VAKKKSAKRRAPGEAAAPAPVRRGPPLELDRETVGQIVASVRLGAHVSAAALAAGFSRRAYQRWLRVGEAALGKLEADPSAVLTDSEDLFAHFAVEYRKALGQLESEATHDFYERSRQDPGDLREFLAARFPRRWGKRERVDVSTTAKTQLQIVEEIVDAPDHRPTPEDRPDPPGPG